MALKENSAQWDFFAESNWVADYKYVSTIGLSLERSCKKSLVESEEVSLTVS